jgi:hypothetical protein
MGVSQRLEKSTGTFSGWNWSVAIGNLSVGAYLSENRDFHSGHYI